MSDGKQTNKQTNKERRRCIRILCIISQNARATGFCIACLAIGFKVNDLDFMSVVAWCCSCSFSVAWHGSMVLQRLNLVVQYGPKCCYCMYRSRGSSSVNNLFCWYLSIIILVFPAMRMQSNTAGFSSYPSLLSVISSCMWMWGNQIGVAVLLFCQNGRRERRADVLRFWNKSE